MKLKNLLSSVLAAAMVFTCGVMNISAEDVEIPATDVGEITTTTVSGADYYESGETLKYFPPMTRGAWQYSNGYIDKTSTLSSTSAADFHLITLSGTKSAVIRFLTSPTNMNSFAVLCPYNPATGDVTLSGPVIYPGETKAYADINANGQNNFALTVIAQGSPYGTYRISMNAKNAGGANQFLYSSADFSNVAFAYPNGTATLNGTNVKTTAMNYINNNINPTTQGTVAIDTIWDKAYLHIRNSVLISQEDIGDLIFGRHVSSISDLSAENAVYIEILPDVAYLSTNYSGINRQGRTTESTFIVLDLSTGKIVDWVSDDNIWYAEYGATCTTDLLYIL